MKKRFIIASAIVALLSTALCGCSEKEPAVVSKPAAPISSVASSNERSEPESLPESTVESTIESAVSESESEPENSPQNAAGYTVTKTSYEDGKQTGVKVYTYDDHGSLIRELTKYDNASYVKGINSYTYEYNDDGTVRMKYDDDGCEEYEYENGLMIKCTRYSGGRVVSVVTHAYNEHGDEVEMTYDLLGSVDRYTYEFTYNENGFWTKELIYKNGELRGTYTCVPGENGEHLSGRLEEENSVFTYEYKYDDEGREIELHTAYTLGGTVVGESRTVTEYDEQGRISRKEEYRLDGGEQLASTEEYKYSIDN